jgi:hypothetical protein
VVWEQKNKPYALPANPNRQGESMNAKVLKAAINSLCMGTLVAAMAACNLSPSPSSTPGTGSVPATSSAGGVVSAPVVHQQTPGEPPGSVSMINDPTDTALAAEHRVNSGENYVVNIFERPFDQNMQTYYPDLDIAKTGYSKDATWVYMTITLVGPDPKRGGLPGVYGVEMDVNKDGRGDYLVVVTAPTSTSWSSDGVKVFADPNHDVGSIHPIQSDPANPASDGYESVLYDQGKGTDPDLAFARIAPNDPHTVQLAFKWSLVNSSAFTWGAWSFDPGMFHPDWFDYNDHFTPAQAGSPVLELKQYYPPKALYLMDNTCRWGAGFIPDASIPGVCPVPVPPTPQPGHVPATPGPTPTATLEPIK